MREFANKARVTPSLGEENFFYRELGLGNALDQRVDEVGNH